MECNCYCTLHSKVSGLIEIILNLRILVLMATSHWLGKWIPSTILNIIRYNDIISVLFRLEIICQVLFAFQNFTRHSNQLIFEENGWMKIVWQIFKIATRRVSFGIDQHTTSPEPPSSSQLRLKSQRTLSRAILSHPSFPERCQTQLKTSPDQEHSFLPR